MAYKRDQGRMARMVAFWSLAILLLYGCATLHTEISARVPKLAAPLTEGLRIPFLGLAITPALLIVVVLAAGGLTLLFRWQQRPRVADLLIETESELRKVTWPSLNEAISSSLVVIVCVLFLMAFLAGSDWVLGRWSTYLLAGRS
jgi:preprotein translocase SecE subunit